MKKGIMLHNKLSEFTQEFFSVMQVKKVTEEMLDLTSNLEPVVVENTDQNFETGNQLFNTVDYVFVRSLDELKKLPQAERNMTATAYAISNGISVSSDGTSPYLLRTGYTKHAVNYVNKNGIPYDTYVNDNTKGDWRGIHISLRAFKQCDALPLGFGNVNTEKHTIEFGCWPKSMVSDSQRLETLLKHGKLTDTDLWYYGAVMANGKLAKNKMYKYNGEYYVRVKQSGDQRYGKALWFQLQMITWVALNWDKLTHLFNPNGDGTAEYIDAYPEQLLDGGIPFYIKQFDDNNAFYQNSTLRGVLNGINVNRIETNGNLRYTAENGGDYNGHGFLQQAFIVPADLLKNLTKNEEQYKAKNLKMRTILHRTNESEISL